MAPLLQKTLRDQRRAFIAWGLGIAGMAAMYAAVYPSIQKSAASLNRYMQSLPDAVKRLIGADYTAPAGSLRAETFSALGPILFLVFAIGAGARAIAGEEEGRTLDLLLSTPIRRRQVLFNKWLSMALTGFGLAAVLWLTIVVVGPPFGLHVALADVAAACISLYLLVLAFGTIALAVGCATGRRGVAIGATSGFATLTYILNVLAPSVHSLSWSRPLSPFRWYLEPDPLVRGLLIANVAVLIAITAVSYVVAWYSFERRDLRA
jgi:ABC-2 type transport system permease protein